MCRVFFHTAYPATISRVTPQHLPVPCFPHSLRRNEGVNGGAIVNSASISFVSEAKLFVQDNTAAAAAANADTLLGDYDTGDFAAFAEVRVMDIFHAAFKQLRLEGGWVHDPWSDDTKGEE